MVCTDSSHSVCAHSFVHTPSKYCGRQNRHEPAKNICMSHKRYKGVTNSHACADARKSSINPQWLSKIPHSVGSKTNCQLLFLLKKINWQKRSFSPSQNSPENPGRLQSKNIASLCPRAHPDSENSRTYTSVHLYPPLSTSVRCAILRKRNHFCTLRYFEKKIFCTLRYFEKKIFFANFVALFWESGPKMAWFERPIVLRGHRKTVKPVWDIFYSPKVTPRPIKRDEVFLRFHTHMKESYTRVRSHTKKISRVTNRGLCADTSSRTSQSWRHSGHC